MSSRYCKLLTELIFFMKFFVEVSVFLWQNCIVVNYFSERSPLKKKQFILVSLTFYLFIVNYFWRSRHQDKISILQKLSGIHLVTIMFSWTKQKSQIGTCQQLKQPSGYIPRQPNNFKEFPSKNSFIFRSISCCLGISSDSKKCLCRVRMLYACEF